MLADLETTKVDNRDSNNVVNVEKLRELAKAASVTHYYSIIFFPKEIRDKVLLVYAFFRIVDDAVDDSETTEKFTEIKYYYNSNIVRQSSILSQDEIAIISSFKELVSEFSFEDEWIQALFKSMEMDIEGATYQTRKELEKYMYGVAGIVGLCITRLLRLPNESHAGAIALGNAAQYINMIRDIGVDQKMGRTYLPSEDIKKNELENLSYEHTNVRKENFSKFVNKQITIFEEYLHEARKYYNYLPKRFLVSIRIIDSIYSWTAKKIAENPTIVYERVVKPSKLRVMFFGIRSLLRMLLS